MAQNLYSKDHKATNPKFRAQFDLVSWDILEDEEKPKEDKPPKIIVNFDKTKG